MICLLLHYGLPYLDIHPDLAAQRQLWILIQEAAAASLCAMLIHSLFVHKVEGFATTTLFLSKSRLWTPSRKLCWKLTQIIENCSKMNALNLSFLKLKLNVANIQFLYFEPQYCRSISIHACIELEVDSCSFGTCFSFRFRSRHSLCST